MQWPAFSSLEDPKIERKDSLSESFFVPNLVESALKAGLLRDQWCLISWPHSEFRWGLGLWQSRQPTKLVFLLLPHDPCHRAPLRLKVMTSYCGALLNCHMSFFEVQIFLISCCSCNGVKLATLLCFAFLLTRHTRSNPLMSVSSVLYNNANNTVGKLSEDF